MPTRREFLGASTGAVTALVAPAFAAAPPELPRGTGQEPPLQAGALPPSIRALTSQKARAHPITVEERRARLEQARRLLTAEKLDALFLTGGTSLDYFTGIRWGLSERLLALVLPRTGPAFVISPASGRHRCKEPRAAARLRACPAGIPGGEHDSPDRRVGGGLRDRGITTGRVG